MAANNIPEWVDGKKINEVLFCEDFLKEYPMVSLNGTFFTVDGLVSDENLLKKKIYDFLKPYVSTGLPKKVSNLLEVLRMECCTEDLPLQTDRIHVENGTLFLDGTFTPEKEFCRNRLTVSYNPNAPEPVAWKTFLSRLLYPEDIPAFQEYFGYCLIASNKAQKMLFVIGKGGEGKSRLGLVAQALFGCNMKTGSIVKLATNPFAIADTQYYLIFVDDDLNMEALTRTNTIKSLVTAELPMDLEKKGQQSYQGEIFARLIAFGNGTLQALHDRSYGFFRRQIILEAKDRDPNRVDDPFLAEKLCEEKDSIFLWALEGLHRLIENNYHFTISERAQGNIDAAMADGNNIVEFMKSEGYFRFKADCEASSKDFYMVYKQWCSDNALYALSERSFCSYLKQHANLYNLEATNNVHIGGGKRVRGFWGIELLQRPI